MFYILLLSGCVKEEKFLYYKDDRNYIDKYITAGMRKRDAVILDSLYLNVRPQSINGFNESVYTHKVRFVDISAKKKVEVVRCFPELGIAKIISISTTKTPYRIDNRACRCYVPLRVLHDTFPAVDTVRFIEY